MTWKRAGSPRFSSRGVDIGVEVGERWRGQEEEEEEEELCLTPDLLRRTEKR